MQKPTVLVLCFLFFFPVYLISEDVQKQEQDRRNEAAILGSVVEPPRPESKMAMATENLQLRASPPEGAFFTKGEKVGILSKNTEVFVVETKTVRTLLGEDKWLKVQPLDKNAAAAWVYSGKDGEYFRIEFKVLNQKRSEDSEQ